MVKTLYRLLPKLITHQSAIEAAAIDLASRDLKDSFSLVLYDATTRSGFPVMHEVFEGNTFEGHTMLEILKRFQQRVGEHCKPVIVADAAMLSTSNMQTLDEQGYRYIVGARLANSATTFVGQIEAQLPR